jgi:hypothetical protein
MESTPASPKKGKTWIWILAILAVILLCCLLALVGTVSLAFWKGYIRMPGLNFNTIPGLTSPIAPNHGNGPTTAPPATQGKLTIEPYQPKTNDHFPSLQTLVPNWQDPTGPGANTYSINLKVNQPVLVPIGWCTTTKAILDQNFQHIQYILEVDGQTVSTSNLFQGNSSTISQSCRDFTGIIHAWPAGKHAIKITMRVNSKINDGWSDYPAGDYVEIYNITAIP